MQKHGSLNHIYRLVWSQLTNGWVAVAETAKGKGKGRNQQRKLIAAALALAAIVGEIPAALAANVIPILPVLSTTIKGSGNAVVTSGAGGMTITQSTQNALLNWNSFNVGESNFVNFVQPNASSVTVNNILGNNPSNILGYVHANGSIFLINPNGIVFGPHAQVNVGGLVASALALEGSGGSYKFSGSGSIDNQGKISSGSYVVLLGSSVTNEGMVTAPLGTIILGAGNQATMNLGSSTGNVSLKIDKSTLKNLVANGGVIIADGGQIIMTAGARDELMASVVNNAGVLQARTVGVNKGSISLLADKEGGALGGTVTVGGMLDASAPLTGDGGAIETSGDTVNVMTGFALTAKSAKGHSGSWLLDPTDLTIAASGGNMTGMDLKMALSSGDTTLKVSGNININDNTNPVTWTGHALILNAGENININAPMFASGAAQFYMYYGQSTQAGTGYVINVTAPVSLTSSMSGNFHTMQGSGGALLDYTIIDATGGVNALQAMSTGGNYVLGSDIDGAATSSWSHPDGAGFIPIGTAGSPFTGVFNGMGHTIANMITVSFVQDDTGALFGGIGSKGVVSNVGLTNATVLGQAETGGLTGFNAGLISNSYFTGRVSGTGETGGLAGSNSGNIQTSYANAETYSNINGGGLAGQNQSSGVISNSYALGAVTAQFDAGGLVGTNLGVINYSYALGVTIGSNYAAGLVGKNSGTITKSYSAGQVFGTSNAGGLTGVGSTGTVTSSYWDKTSSNQTLSGGGTGLVTADMQNTANMNQFNFTTTPGTASAWVMVDADGTLNGSNGATYPMLASEYSQSIRNVHQLQLMNMNLTQHYMLANNIDASGTGTAGADVWNTANGFVPVGTNGNPFLGTLDGQGNTIDALTVHLANDTNYAGLFGQTGSSSSIVNLNLTNASVSGDGDVGALVGDNSGLIRNSSSSGTVLGNSIVGGLIGYMSGGTVAFSHAGGTVTASTIGFAGGLVGSANSGTISTSYASASVSGNNEIGGLIGLSGASVNACFATGNVSGGLIVGGLIGFNGGPVTFSYATGPVTVAGASQAGGLIGINVGTVNQTYATGVVTAGVGGTAGGLVGLNNGGTVTASYWDTSTNNADGGGGGSTGVSGADIKNIGTFAGWDFGNTWFIYPAQTAPLLQVFMKPVTIALVSNALTSTYNTSPYNVANNVAWFDGITKLPIPQPATDIYTSPVSGPVNAGIYSIAPGGFYSDQLGYMITPKTSGTLTINQAPLSISTQTASNKTYDSTTTATLNTAMLSGVFASDLGNVGIAPTASFAQANVGNGIAVTVNENLSGPVSGNYYLQNPATGLSANITPETVVVTTRPVIKTYDGSTVTSGSSVIQGPLAIVDTSQPNPGSLYGDTLTGGTFAFSPNGNAGINKTVTVSNVKIANAANAGNFNLVDDANTTSTINPATLWVSNETADSRFYNGTVAARLESGKLHGVLGTDVVTLNESGLTGTFASPNASITASSSGNCFGLPGISCNPIAVTGHDTLSGAAAGNYTLQQQSGMNAYIAPIPLAINGTAQNKVYDGNSSATMVPTAPNTSFVTALFSFAPIPTGEGFAASTETGVFSSKNVGMRSVAVTDKVIPNAGTSLNNYILPPTNFTTIANITPARLYYVANPKSILPGVKPTGLGGTMSGFVGGYTLLSALSGKPIWSTTATSTSKAPATYPITGSGYTANFGDYQLFQDAGNANALCISATLNCGIIIRMEQIHSSAVQQATASGASAPDTDNTLLPVQTVLKSTPVPQADDRQKLPNLQIRDGGVKLPENAVAMN